MKKIFLSLIACSLLIFSLTGCTGNSNTSGSSDSSGDSFDDDAQNSSSSSDSGSSSSDSGSDSSDSGGADNSDLEFPANRAGRMAAAAIYADSWPKMDVVSDTDMIDSVFSTDEGIIFNLDDLEEYCFCTNVISAQLYRVIVVKPVDGREGAVEDVMNKYLDYSMNGAALYPAQEESAAGAVSGKTSDNYIYLVVHQNGEAIAEAMKDVM